MVLSAVPAGWQCGPQPQPVTRFAALGDSVTLGLGDPMPQGGWRGWAALLAGSLAPPDQVELCNLALSGALIRDVAHDQLPQALSLAPTVATVLVGMNDTLRGKFDLTAIATDLEEIIRRLQHGGALVCTGSLPDPGLLLRIPDSLRRPLARRARAINAVLGQLARHYDVLHVDLAANPAIYDKRMWGVDRLHPSERGHRLMARLFGAGLAGRGLPLLALPDPEPANPEPSAWAQALWMATKGTGWIVRRSRDLVPRLVQLAMAEWWHGVRGRDAGQPAAHQAAADQPAAHQPAAHQPAAYQAAAHQAAAHQAAVDRDAGPYPAVLRGR
jgi:lysophospholipase L1-like esterase